MSGGINWTEDDVNRLRLDYNRKTNNELLKEFPGRTHLAIYKKARKIGLYKDADIEFMNRSEARRREKASNWNGGISHSRKGYVMVLRPEHGRADKRGYVMEHILIWEEKTGLTIPDNCVIHHLNGDKTDNRISNLCLMERGAHTTLHHTGLKHTQETKNKISQKRRKAQCSI